MAERKNTRKKKSGDSNIGCLIVLAVLLLMIGLVLFNREAIGKSFNNFKSLDRVLQKEPPAAAPRPEPPKAAPVPAPVEQTPAPAQQTVQPEPKKPEPRPTAAPAPSTGTPPQEEPIPKPTAAPPRQTKPSPAEPSKTAPTAAPAVKPKQPVPDNKTSRERTLWFVRIEDDGVIARVKVTRNLTASDTPLVDALAALIAGPSAAEQKKGCSTLIPKGTRLLTATVRGSTAYLSFNDQFQFNSFGIEGYAAQLRQVIWTATEFDSVKDVQFLIEGRRVDYLGAEGIFIGSPLGRDSI